MSDPPNKPEPGIWLRSFVLPPDEYLTVAPEQMKVPTITLPRAVVEQLVDPEHEPYLYRDGECCSYCSYGWNNNGHDADCPVRIVQEALAKGTGE